MGGITILTTNPMNDKLKQRFEETMKLNGNHLLWSETALELILKNMQSAYNIAYAEAEQDKWVSVEDGLPEEGVDVICTDDFTCYAIGWYADDNFFNDKVMNVTAWQPLPKSPISK